MKSVLFVAALAIGTAAVGQTTDPTTSGGQTVAPSNANPEEDARGITVISAPAEVPSGANAAAPAAAPGQQVVPRANQQQVFATRPSQEEYPVCSRTVTDNCVQAYERGVSRPD